MTHFALAAAVLLVAACDSRAPERKLDVQRQTISGTFEGQAGTGEEIVLTLGQTDEVLQGTGSNNGDPLVISGVVSWSAFATLTRDDGSTSAVELELSGRGDTLTVRPHGGPDFVLERNDLAASAREPEGPLSGTFEVHDKSVLVGVASIVQRGDLLVGMANLQGAAAGINARLVERGQAKGILTFLDRSQIPFEAKFSEDGGSVTLRGLGAPIHLERVGESTP